MAPIERNGRFTLWLLGALFTVALGAVSAYAGLANSENISGHVRMERRLDRLENLEPAVSALDARVDASLKSIDGRLGSIERKLDTIAQDHRRRRDR